MDITVVSFLPWALNELKPGLIPENYYIPPAKDGIPGVLHIRDARSNLYVRDGKTYPITHPAEEVANSIVADYCTAQLQGSSDAKPALFWVPGKWSGSEILTKFITEVAEAKTKQNVWFLRLVRLADDDWARFGQHRMITDLQRHAARSLGQLNKPWMQNLEPTEYVKCPACATLVDINAAVCANCGYITNKDKAKVLGIESTKVSVK
jgi:hypothetical protein